MIRYVLLSLFLISANDALSQAVAEWGFGSITDENDRISAVNPNGGIYIAASFDEQINLQPSTSDYVLTPTGGYDSYLLKLSAEGNIEWVLQSNCDEDDFPRSMTVAADGSLLIIGNYSGTMTFGNSTITGPSYSGGGGTYIAKILSNGQTDWVKSADYHAYLSTMDSLENIYLIGSFADSVDMDPGISEHWEYASGITSNPEPLVQKLDPYGNLIWVEGFEADVQDVKFTSIKINSQDEVCMVGYFDHDVDFDPGPSTYVLSTPTHPDIFFLKLNGLGQFLWAKQIGNSNGDFGHDMVLDNQDNWIVTGDFSQYSQGIMDFDPGPGTHILTSLGGWDAFILKLDSDGNFVWVKKFGSVDHERGWSIATDSLGAIYGTGLYSNTIDFDPGPSTFFLTEDETISIYYDAFLVKLDSDGNFVWAESIISNGGTFVGVDNGLSVYISGTYGYFDEPLILSPSTVNLSIPVTSGSGDDFTTKFRQKGVLGRLYFDADEDCVLDSNEFGLADRLIMVEPGGFVAQTNAQGIWYIDELAPGNYTLVFDTLNGWSSTCTTPIQFTVGSTLGATAVSPVGLVNNSPCAKPSISIHAPFLRRCFSDQRIYVQSCNSSLASEVQTDSYVELEMSPYMTPGASSLPYTIVGDEILRVETGDLQPAECVSFWVSTEISCNASLNQTLCLRGDAFPLDSCMLDTLPAPLPEDFTPCNLPWDQSSIEVTGWCDSDSVRFRIANIGEDMSCYSPYRLFIDGHYILMDSVVLAGGEVDSIAFLADGRTWRLEVDQHPLHPGNSQPSSTVELCNNLGGWTPHLVATLPQDEFNPMVDIYCGAVTGSYDPNDKTGYPLGVGPAHLVEPNGQLDYVIRFQNTGTDTAFTVVIRDTLDSNLDIFSLESGVSDHSYDFRIYGPRVAEWTFNNIMLPDSTTDLSGSQGFVCFKIDQQPNLSPGTEINNSADIYFDFNEPIITNTTSHVIASEPGRTELDTVELQGCDQVDFNGETYFTDGTYFTIVEGAPDTMLIANVNLIDVDVSVIEVDNALSGQFLNESLTFQWLNCDQSLAIISGETDSIFYPSQSGNYALEATEYGCIDTSACVNVLLVEIATPTQSGIAVYPNPTSDYVRLEFGTEVANITANLFNSLGKLLETKKLISGNATEIRLPDETGFYLIQLIHSNGTTDNFKVLKE